MRIVVTGGRKYSDRAMVNDVLDVLNPMTVFVGDATGADALAVEWAVNNDRDLIVYKADWDKYGKSAGPRRNEKMLKEAGVDAVVITFHDNKGTKNCIKQTKAMNMIVLRVEE